MQRKSDLERWRDLFLALPFKSKIQGQNRVELARPNVTWLSSNHGFNLTTNAWSRTQTFKLGSSPSTPHIKAGDLLVSEMPCVNCWSPKARAFDIRIIIGHLSTPIVAEISRAPTSIHCKQLPEAAGPQRGQFCPPICYLLTNMGGFPRRFDVDVKSPLCVRAGKHGSLKEMPCMICWLPKS